MVQNTRSDVRSLLADGEKTLTDKPSISLPWIITAIAVGFTVGFNAHGEELGATSASALEVASLPTQTVPAASVAPQQREQTVAESGLASVVPAWQHHNTVINALIAEFKDDHVIDFYGDQKINFVVDPSLLEKHETTVKGVSSEAVKDIITNNQQDSMHSFGNLAVMQISAESAKSVINMTIGVAGVKDAKTAHSSNGVIQLR